MIRKHKLALFIYLFICEKEVRRLKTMACGPDKETSVGDTIPPLCNWFPRQQEARGVKVKRSDIAPQGWEKSARSNYEA